MAYGIPFEQFAHGRGGSDGGKQVETTKLYETLQVKKDATQREIKTAYFRLSKLHHPDKGGDEQKFKEISAAYEILSDKEKREMYDKYGLDGVNDDGRMPPPGSEDLFSMFFGGGRQQGRHGHGGGPRKGPSINHPINVSLADLYNGKTVKMAINRTVIDGEVVECDTCHGQGGQMETREISPGMVTQMHRTCSACEGHGKTAPTKSERKVVEVHIEKGMRDGQRVTFRNMGDEIPGAEEAGDVHFILQQKEDRLFKRKGADLLTKKKISLNQALCGFTWQFTHLDGRKVVIKTREGQIIDCETRDETTGQTMPYFTVVKDEGMPSQGNPFVRGDLYVAFYVEFPKKLDKETISTLQKLLPDADMQEEYDPETVDEHCMDVADLRNFGHGGAVVEGNEYDSDEEGDQQGLPQCQQS